MKETYRSVSRAMKSPLVALAPSTHPFAFRNGPIYPQGVRHINL
jgi:hypothetical protein